jgi:SAM-dependent methyltransferase
MAKSPEIDLELEEGIDQELENILNHPAPAYGETDYWINRYKLDPDTQFEWFQPWSAIAPAISKYLTARTSALVIGCGTSTMSADLLPLFQRIVSIDIVDTAIGYMKERYKSEGKLEWQVMDCTKLQF